MKRTLIASSIAVILVGCATATSQTIAVTETPMPVSAQIEAPVGIVEETADTRFCESTQRDLTVLWVVRRYWCSDNEKTVPARSTDQKTPTQKNIVFKALTPKPVLVASADTAIEYSPSYFGPDAAVLGADKPKAKIVAVDPKTQMLALSPPKDGDQSFNESNSNSDSVREDSSKPFPTFEQLAVAASKLPASIVFAKNLRVLGPQGRAASDSLIQQVKEADLVKIRGLLLPDEAQSDSPTYREIISVGRALAVRAHWRKQGLDISHIKILHHDPKLHGRAVLVYFDA